MFIFYDTETTGLNADFDQILQIALVFTDDNLNVLASKKLECRRSPWVVPSPGAMLITGFTPDDLKNAKLSHAEMMKEIVQWCRNQHWPVIFAGYNTIGFDEAIFARNLEQNMQDPFLTTASNGFNKKSNGRLDVFTIVKAIYAYMPAALKLDEKNDFGSVSLALSRVAEQNGVKLSDEDAHDAMNDIKATLGVAKIAKKTAPQLWEQMTALATVKGVDDFIAKNDIFTHATVSGGKVNAAVVTEIADGILFNLASDPAFFMNKTAEQLADLWVPKSGNPFRIVKKTDQPILMPVDQSDAVLPKDFNDQIALQRAAMLASDPDFRARLAEAQKIVEAKIVRPLSIEPEQWPINGLTTAQSVKLDQWKKEFASAPDWREAAHCLSRFYQDTGEDAKNIQFRRFVNFAGRMVFENAPQYLSPQQQEAMRQYIARRILNPSADVKWMTVAKARLELDKIEQERHLPKWKHITDKEIRALKLYYTTLEKEYASYMPPAQANDNPVVKQDIRKNNFKP